MAYQLTDEDRKLAQIMGNQMYQQSLMAQPKAAPKSAPNNILDFILPTIGGIGGAIGGTLLAPVAGTAAGGAGGAALGKIIANKLSGRDSAEGVGTEALLGSLGGAGKLVGAARGAGVATQAAKRPGLFARAGQNLEQRGLDAISSNINIPTQAARELRPRDTLALLNQEFGIKNIDEASDIAGVITGKNGLGTEAMRQAAYSSRGVSPSVVSKAMDAQLTKDGVFVNPTTRKALQTEKQTMLDQVFGGKGSLNPTAPPAEMYDIAQDYGKRAFKLGIKDDVAANQTGQVYKAGERAIKDAIFGDPAVKAELPAIRENYVKLLRQEAVTRGGNQAKVLNRFADKVAKIEDPADLSKTMSPFVKAGQIQEQRGITANTVGGQSVLNSQNSGVTNIARNAANSPTAGNMYLTIGRALQGKAGAGATGGAAGRITRGDIVKQALIQGVPRALISGAGAGATAETMGEEVDPAIV